MDRVLVNQNGRACVNSLFKSFYYLLIILIDKVQCDINAHIYNAYKSLTLLIKMHDFSQC